MAHVYPHLLNRFSSIAPLVGTFISPIGLSSFHVVIEAVPDGRLSVARLIDKPAEGLGKSIEAMESFKELGMDTWFFLGKAIVERVAVFQEKVDTRNDLCHPLGITG